MARWLIFLFQGQDMAGQTIQNCTQKSLHSVKTPSTTGGSSLFCLCKLTIMYPYILQKSKKKLSVTLQTWKTIHNDTYLSPKKSSTISCDTWIVWEMVQKIIPKIEKTDTLKPWSELDLLDFLVTWWCLARMILLNKYRCTDLKFIYIFVLHEILGFELYGHVWEKTAGRCRFVAPMWTSSTVPSSHWPVRVQRQPRHGRVLAPTRPATESREPSRMPKLEMLVSAWSILYERMSFLEWLTINPCFQTKTLM